MGSRARKASRGRLGPRVIAGWLDEMAAMALTEATESVGTLARQAYRASRGPLEPQARTDDLDWTGRRVFLVRLDPQGRPESGDLRVTRATPDRPESP